MSIFTLAVGLHNIIRQIVFILGINALFRAIFGWVKKRSWSQTDRKIALFYTIAIDIQLLLGLVLFLFISPNTTRILKDFSGVTNNPTVRFFVIEHTIMMFLAVVFVHFGSATTKKDIPDDSKFKRMAILFGLALLALILGMPWDRPLIPDFK